jgi:hypothetical protein
MLRIIVRTVLLAKRHPKAAAKIVEKLLPLTVNGSGLGSSTIGTINVVSVPVGTYLSAEDIQKIQPANLIEQEPQLEQLEPEHFEDPAEIEIEAQPVEPEVETGIQVIRSASLAHRRQR